ncbi:16S rRNA (guanine(527)-N(7))-methyltransferase RsmG [Oribacterium sp. WCC10]|uniref:16S rRNA (guanine(527)-N(7))-methyltransferase RsmG n=1 Tax=Oribacterium sp. WCC10 TaxID=1855343 RepID=UPI0008ED4637|nr:16S rRNA (guanine(527)-N(7))-methyltransferase RsmG [Oribacterium sp. WCC10]SFG72235.1 16S rRNA m(7)G-527 methyltransferase [Oribacterium sp. WCC10]
MTETFIKDLSENIGKIGIKLSDLQIEQLYKFYYMLVEKNKVMNLTAITEEHEVIVKHFIDSMSINNLDVEDKKLDYNFLKNKKLIDIGTGAGFPGLVLKIIYPELNVVLSDSLNKRLIFIKEVIDELNLKQIELVHGRAEDLAHNIKYREKFDLATSRAVANLSTLSEYDLPFVKINGYFIPYKSGKIEEELSNASNAINLVGGQVVGKSEFKLTDNETERSLIVIKKIKKTPNLYPRKAGTPSKTPL